MSIILREDDTPSGWGVALFQAVCIVATVVAIVLGSAL